MKSERALMGDGEGARRGADSGVILDGMMVDLKRSTKRMIARQKI